MERSRVRVRVRVREGGGGGGGSEGRNYFPNRTLFPLISPPGGCLGKVWGLCVYEIFCHLFC